MKKIILVCGLILASCINVGAYQNSSTNGNVKHVHQQIIVQRITEKIITKNTTKNTVKSIDNSVENTYVDEQKKVRYEAGVGLIIPLVVTENFDVNIDGRYDWQNGRSETYLVGTVKMETGILQKVVALFKRDK